MPFMITSDTSKQYLREEDAVKGFEIAVGNGQTRMALTILVDVINGMMDIFNSVEDELEEEEITAAVAVEEPKLQKQVVVNELLEQEVQPVTKPVAKKETKTTEEK